VLRENIKNTRFLGLKGEINKNYIEICNGYLMQGCRGVGSFDRDLFNRDLFNFER
jgi:hypothetical protein